MTHLTPIRLYAPPNDGETPVLLRFARADRLEALAVIAVLIVAYVALEARTCSAESKLVDLESFGQWRLFLTWDCFSGTNIPALCLPRNKGRGCKLYNEYFGSILQFSHTH